MFSSSRSLFAAGSSILRSRLAIQNKMLIGGLRSHEFSTSSQLLKQSTVNRPLSPHLTIYEPQLTWVMSIAHRMTGAGLSAGVWLGSLSYLAGGFTGASAVAAAAALPSVVVFGGKLLLAAPFTYHTFNGIRHLLWDMGYFLSIKHVYTTGHAVNAATAISTLGIMFM